MLTTCLLLFASDFFTIGNVFLLFGLLYVLFQQKRIAFTSGFWLLMLFSFVFSVVDLYVNHTLNFLVFLYPLAHLLGANILQNPTKVGIKRLLKILSIGMALHGILNFAYETILLKGFNYSSLHYDIWSRSLAGVTGQMTNYVFLLIFAGACIFYSRKYGWISLMIIIGTVHAVLGGSRTYIVMLGISIGIGLLFDFLVRKKKRLKRICWFLLASGGIALFVWAAYKNDWLGIRSFWTSSYLYHRLFSEYAKINHRGMFTTGRWATKLEYIKLLLVYPLGGNHIRKQVGWYAHDIWLDTADKVGILPSILIVLYTLRIIIRGIKYAFYEDVSLEDKMIFASYTLLIAIQFLMEPVLSSAPQFFQAVCMLDGMLSIYLDSKSRSKNFHGLENKRINV